MASAKECVNAAWGQKGYTESGNNKTKFGQWFGMDGEPWCAMFVSWCFAQVGMGGEMPKTASAGEFAYQAQKSGKGTYHAKGSGYTPKCGDLFIKNYNGGGYADHVGIVYSDAAGGSFTTIEGNCNDSVASIPRQVSDYCYVTPPFSGAGTRSGTTTLQPQRETVITVTTGLGKYYTYMAWTAITNMDTLQGKLIKTAGRNYDSDGYGIVGSRYTVAMTSTFGGIGDYVDIYMENGRVIHGIIADEKSQVYTSWDHNPANRWGHDDGQCIVEWVTNWKNHDNPPSDGAVLKVINLGNYFDYPEYASGNTESYMYSENSYTDTEKEPTVVWNNRIKENIHTAVQNTVEIPSTGELAIYANGVDITKIAGNLSWKNSIYELATTMSFDVAKSDAAYLTDLMYTPKVGDIVQFVTNIEIFRGVIIKVDDGDVNSNKYSIVDLGWYLNKTSQTYQFKNITATDAIKELCTDLSINIVMLPELTTVTNQIYFDKTVSAILTDILDKCDGDYNFDFVPDGLRIYKIGELIAYPEFQIASNIPQESSPNFRGNVSHSLSIEEMKNSIKITSEKDSVYTELMVRQNRELIDKYGFLQKIVKIDPEKESADTVAERELTENAKEAKTYSFEIIEKYDSYTRAGEVITVDDVCYVIESTVHSIVDGWHFNKLELRKVVKKYECIN